MLVKLDEDLSPLVAQPLLDAGHEVRSVASQNWGGLKDDELWRRVSEEAAFFVTADKGFGDIRHFPPGTHAGILVLRPDRESLAQFRALIVDVLARGALDELTRSVAVATPSGLRARRPAGPKMHDQG